MLERVEDRVAGKLPGEFRRCAEVVTTPRNSDSAALAINGAWKYRPPNP
jgi:hypothetical protein